MAAPIHVSLPSILLLLAVATIATAHQRPPPTDETIVLKKCSDALGPDGSALVSFCAKDLLGPKAALLSGCGKQETVDVVIEEAQKRAEAVADMEKKIVCDKSLSGEELHDLKMCWGAMNVALNSVGNIYANVAVNNLSFDVVMGGLLEKSTAAKENCRMVSGAEKHSSLWEELNIKVKESLKAQIVAMAFMNDQRHKVLN